MKQLAKLLGWDILLLHRNRLFVIALVLTLVYIGIFFLLKPLGNLSNLLILLIINDPIVTGFVFAAILWIFDKQQKTLQALAVVPFRLELYLLSKCLLLSLLGAVAALVMAIAARGLDFDMLHLFVVVFLTTFMFACFGFTFAALAKTLNRLLVYMIPWFVACGIPVVSLFGIEAHMLMWLLPTTGVVQLLDASLTELSVMAFPFAYLQLVVYTILSWVIMVRVTKKRML